MQHSNKGDPHRAKIWAKGSSTFIPKTKLYLDDSKIIFEKWMMKLFNKAK